MHFISIMNMCTSSKHTGVVLDVHDLVQFCFVFRYFPRRCQVNKVEMADFGFAHFGDDDLNEEEEEEAAEVCFYYCIMCMYVLRGVCPPLPVYKHTWHPCLYLFCDQC